MKYKSKLAALVCAAALASSCGMTEPPITDIISETSASEPTPADMGRSVPAGLSNDLEGAAFDEPFTSYTYDFSVAENNYMITVMPDETRTGLELTIEDNQFEFSKFNVIPPAGYMVGLPYSQQYASEVCTVIKSTSEDKNKDIPDLLKIDFYLMEFGDEDMPYTVSRLYSIKDGRFVEIELFDTVPSEDDAALQAAGYSTFEMAWETDYLERMDCIPESDLYRTESLTFMPEPKVTVLEDGSLEAEVVTYTLNPDDMTMRRAKQDCTPDNPLYYGYAAHAIAGNIYQYFIATSLTVSEGEDYVKVPSADGGEDKYFFKVDDPRFSTKAELQAYVERYFDEDLVTRMFLKAPQQYCDIDGALYTIQGDGGINEELGKLTITGWDTDGNTITYHTKQEKFNSEHVLDGYIDGGDFVIEIKDGGGFIVKQYRYPTEN